MIKRFAWLFLLMSLVGPVLGFLAAGVVTYVMPKRYESRATIELKPVIARIESAKPHPNFLATEMEKIKSDRSLGGVVDALDLTNRWGVDKESAVGLLKEIVTTDLIRGTDLVEVRARSKNPSDARDIAMGVAKAYVEDRGEGRLMEAGLRELRKQVREQEDRVAEQRKILAMILRAKEAIPNAGAMPSPDRQDQEDARREFEAGQSLLQDMKLELIGGEITSKMLSEGAVIHKEPVLARTPISPNVVLNLISGTLLGLLLSPLLALPVIWIASRISAVKS